MQKNIFLLALFIFSGVFRTSIASAQMGVQCYTGSWVQPTCNPTISDPESCNILPPLFSGASCDQHTGYLRIQDEANTADTAAWTQLYPGKIMVGSVTDGYVVSNGGVEIFGPIVSGNFTAGSPPPTGYNSQGDIASAYDIYAGGALRITGSSSFYGTINAYNSGTFIASVFNGNLLQVVNTAGFTSNASTLYVGQLSGDVGRALDIFTANRNNVYIDYLGYLNATKDFQIRIDSDNDFNQNYFLVNNGDNSTIFQIAEDGNVQIAGDAIVARTLTAGTVVANSGGAGKGKIWGNFTDLNNNTCTADQLLVYRDTPFTPGWYCVAATNVGTTTVSNLLQTLQAGADASTFNGNPKIGHGNTAGGVFLTGNGAPGTLTIQYRDSSQNSAGAQIGQIGFATQYNDLDEAKIVVTRGASGSGGDYPTNMSFWTTPDGSVIAQERLTILHNGNIGINNINPIARLNVNVPTNTEGIRVINNNYSPLVIRNSTDTIDLFRVNESGNVTANGTIRGRFTDGDGNLCANNQILVYNSGTSKWVCSNSIPGGSQNLLSVLGTGSNASTYTADTSIGGNLGLGGISTPTHAIHVSKGAASGGYGSLALETAAAGRNSYIEIRNSDTGQIPYIDLTKGWTSGNTPDYSGRIAYWSDNDFRIIQAANNPLSFWTNNTKRLTIAGNGFVGVGADPTSMFHVHGAAGLGWNSGFQLTRTGYSGDFRINLVNTETYFRNMIAGQNFEFRNSADQNIFKIYSNSPYVITGNFAAYNATNCTNGQVLIKDASNRWICGTVTGSTDNLGNHTATQNLNMNGFSIVNALNGTFSGTLIADKINVNTIDPIYTIQGEKYATYVPAMTGVKEETTGIIKLRLDKSSGLAISEISFDLLDKGSDLWLFAQTINYQKNFDKIIVLLTPAFDGQVWYEKDVNNKILKIFAKPINSLLKEYEVSYRLTGPRFDYQQWPNNIIDEETEGLNIDKFLQNNR